LAKERNVRVMLAGIVMRHSLLKMLAGRNKVTKPIARHPKRIVGLDEANRVLGTLR
jgi:hypothetical protein